MTETTPSVRDHSLFRDDSGAILVLALCMACCLVGCVWYMVGFGEAMVYRQQLRAAADATAFESAVLHAIGMNTIAMINIAMAMLLSILVFLQLILAVLVALTIIAALLLLIPGVNVVSLGAVRGLVEADKAMIRVIHTVQEPIFKGLCALNISAGVEAIVMPWVAHLSAKNVPDDYGPAAEQGDGLQPFSWSMIPNRVPLFSNFAENWFSDKLEEKVPIIKRIKDKTGLAINPAKLLTSRYGLPVQDDKYPVLCQHAAQELVGEFATVADLSLSKLKIPHADPSIFDGFSYWFGMFVGQFPGLFCSGVDPMLAIKNQIGVGPDDLPLPKGGAKGWYTAFQEISKQAKDATSKGELYKNSMYPMKTYDLFQNGNGFGQVWAIIKGKESLTTGSATGVDIALWGKAKGAPPANTSGNSVDFAEAEFYYDCGPSSGRSAPGRDDSSGNWGECKYNAMWNMKWKARLRRYHPFEMNALKMAQLAIYNGLGAEGFVQKMLGLIPGIDGNGVAAKYGIVDSVKSCLTGIGQGSSAYQVGGCPIPVGGSKGNGTVSPGWNSDAPGITDYNQVLH
jgi:hypothetical protein